MIFVQGMQGLGDSVYQRAVVAALAREDDVVLSTPWPQLYSDMDVRFLRSPSPLRTQSRNIDAQPGSLWVEKPAGASRRKVHYAGCWDRGDSMLVAMAKSAQATNLPLPLSLPQPRIDGRWTGYHPAGSFPGPDGPAPKQGVAVVRPVTRRTEWPDTARNPDPAYVQAAALALMDAGYHVICVADIDGVNEVLVGTMPPADEYFIRGELSVADLIDLMWSARAAVGGVGWLLPFSIASQTPHLCILGGHGRSNCPEVLVDPMLDTGLVTWAVPDNFCRCDAMRHDCDKTISRSNALIAEWIAGLCEI